MVQIARDLAVLAAVVEPALVEVTVDVPTANARRECVQKAAALLVSSSPNVYSVRPWF